MQSNYCLVASAQRGQLRVRDGGGAAAAQPGRHHPHRVPAGDIQHPRQGDVTANTVTSLPCPLQVWLLRDYPATPPYCYILPTKDMELSVSPYLDHSGQFRAN